jgi:hypothetical protein
MFGTFIMPPANPTEVQIVIEQWREVIGALVIRYIDQPPAQPLDHGRLFAVFHGTRTLIYAELLNQPEHVGLIPIAPRACGLMRRPMAIPLTATRLSEGGTRAKGPVCVPWMMENANGHSNTLGEGVDPRPVIHAPSWAPDQAEMAIGGSTESSEHCCYR